MLALPWSRVGCTPLCVAFPDEKDSLGRRPSKLAYLPTLGNTAWPSAAVLLVLPSRKRLMGQKRKKNSPPPFPPPRGKGVGCRPQRVVGPPVARDMAKKTSGSGAVVLPALGWGGCSAARWRARRRGDARQRCKWGRWMACGGARPPVGGLVGARGGPHEDSPPLAVVAYCAPPSLALMRTCRWDAGSPRAGGFGGRFPYTRCADVRRHVMG